MKLVQVIINLRKLFCVKFWCK